MCGIAGRLELDGSRVVRAQDVRRMCATLVHRGPDDEGVHVDGPAGIGMRRLSIIDLATGRQPIANEDGSVWTVLNGEIYNYRELRAELAGAGHVFRTASDTEVIVHLYEQHGEAFLDRLAGMFALALWDARERMLLLARDRLGIKPLYYATTPTALLFGSEPKALLVAGLPRELDRQALHDYLSLNYVPGPRTIFRGIAKLPPGHRLTCRRGRLAVDPYWRLRRGAPRGLTEDAALEALDDLLKHVVRQHLLSDVPLGVFLSGGLDSSGLVALMREVSPARVRTFSIGFDDPSYDELAVAREVASRFETEHHELVVGPPSRELLDALVASFDEPFADSSAIPVYHVARLARRHVTVALSGEGGDEVFAGYETYAAYRIAAIYRALPRLLGARLIPWVVRRLPVSHRRVSLDYRAKRFVEGALLPPEDGHFAWKAIFSEADKAALCGDGPGLDAAVDVYRRAFREAEAPDVLGRLQYVDLTVYLPDDLLVKADRMSMANSLEVRVPYLDHRIVELAATLPPTLRLRGLTKKYALRRLMAHRLPPRVLHGRKRGFNVPIPRWLGRELRPVVHEVLSPARLRAAGVFDPAVVARLVESHERRRHDWSRNIWSLVMFMLWHDAYMRPSSEERARARWPAVA